MPGERGLRSGEDVAGTRYRVRGLIGSGGMGAVYEVEHRELGKPFVMKVLRDSLLDRSDLVARMENEWRALGRLAHPNIVEVIDAGRTADGVPFYVMERLEGDTLYGLLRRSRQLSVPRSMRLALGLLEGLAAAHAIGVVHRDMKPQNVFVPAAGGVKILDFGVAKLRDRSAEVVTARGVAIGTPRYMAPEQAEGRAIDGRADIYAVGLVLFEMITGESPFARYKEPHELVLAQMGEVPPRLDALVSSAPRSLGDLVARWLEKAPEARGESASSAAVELRKILSRYSFDDRDARDAIEDTDAPTLTAGYVADTELPSEPRSAFEGDAADGDRTMAWGSAGPCLDEATIPTATMSVAERSGTPTRTLRTDRDEPPRNSAGRGGAQQDSAHQDGGSPARGRKGSSTRSRAASARNSAEPSRLEPTDDVGEQSAPALSRTQAPLSASRRPVLYGAGLGAMLVLAGGWFLANQTRGARTASSPDEAQDAESRAAVKAVVGETAVPRLPARADAADPSSELRSNVPRLQVPELPVPGAARRDVAESDAVSEPAEPIGAEVNSPPAASTRPEPAMPPAPASPTKPPGATTSTELPRATQLVPPPGRLPRVDLSPTPATAPQPKKASPSSTLPSSGL